MIVLPRGEIYTSAKRLFLGISLPNHRCT